MKPILITLPVLFLTSIAFAETIQCKVTEIHDGDTFTCLTDKKQPIRIKLYELDAPELDQPYGQEAKLSLSEILKLDTDVNIEIRELHDKSHNTLGTVLIDLHPHVTLDVGIAMLELGAAWYYPTAIKNERYARKQWQAKESKRGLWSQPNPIPPWTWRKLQNVK